jgi:IS30 family transposase
MGVEQTWGRLRTPAERTCRLVLLTKMKNATAAAALEGFSAKVNSIAAPMRGSLTFDQGKELDRQRRLILRERQKAVLVADDTIARVDYHASDGDRHVDLASPSL